MAEPKFQDSKREFSKELVKAREAKELDLAKISERTKISVDYLLKLEAGDWDFLPSSYVRAFLRTYAQTVGMDVGDALARYDRIIGTAPATEPTLGLGEPDTGKRQKAASTSGSPKFTLADESRGGGGNQFQMTPAVFYGVVAVVVVAILLAVWFFLVSPKLEGRDSQVDEIPFEEVVRESQTSAGEVDDAAEDSTVVNADSLLSNAEESRENDTPVRDNPREAVAEDESVVQPDQDRTEQSEPPSSTPISSSGQLTLQANVSQACYVRVMADHDTANVFDTILNTGASRSFAADSVFRVVIGNTNGVELLLNNRRLRNIGERGRVVTLTIDRSGIRTAEAGNRELHPRNE